MTSNITPNLRFALDKVRAIGGQLGLRDGKSATVRYRTESSADWHSDGTFTVVDTTITFSGSNPLFTRLSSRDVVHGQGRWKDGMYKLGPITPPYTSSLGATGGYPTTVWEPAEVFGSKPREVLVNLKGTGMRPVSGSWFKVVEVSTDSTLHYDLILQRTEDSDQ